MRWLVGSEVRDHAQHEGGNDQDSEHGDGDPPGSQSSVLAVCELGLLSLGHWTGSYHAAAGQVQQDFAAGCRPAILRPEYTGQEVQE
jgi:hypothetical protein